MPTDAPPQQPLLMLSLPNSGSSWLGEVIAKHTAWNRYCMEFFNPLRSPKHYGTLRRQFGCELVDCYDGIASAGDENIDRDIRGSWGLEQFNFTKEVFSPFKLEAFTRHFRCFVLLRTEEDTFPPKRLRIWSFYEHAWWALVRAGRIDLDSAQGFEERALAAHRLMANAIRVDAQLLGVPVIEYRQLFDDEALPGRLEAALGTTEGSLLTAIQESRRLVER